MGPALFIHSKIQEKHVLRTALNPEPADVSDSASWMSLVKQTLDEFGDLHVLVNNAGTSYTNKVSFYHFVYSSSFTAIIFSRQPTLDVTENDFDKCFNVNVKSIFHSVAAVLPHFLSKKQGVMINGVSIVFEMHKLILMNTCENTRL